MEYKILNGTSYPALEKSVNEALKEGWELYQGIVMTAVASDRGSAFTCAQIVIKKS